MITVSELIEILEKQDSDAPVLICIGKSYFNLNSKVPVWTTQEESNNESTIVILDTEI